METLPTPEKKLSKKPEDCRSCVQADDYAKERFESYVKNELEKGYSLDNWKVYTYLLKQAKKYKRDKFGTQPPQYLEHEKLAEEERAIADSYRKEARK